MKWLALVVLALLLPLGSASAPMAQSNAAAGVVLSDKTDASPARGNVFLVRRAEFYLADPVVSVLARPMDARVIPIASKFSVRGWWDRDQVRVVVYAVISDRQSPTGEIETPIATRLLKVGQPAEIGETEAWKAAHVFVNVIPGSALH
jgi:hypothetical protein